QESGPPTQCPSRHKRDVKWSEPVPHAQQVSAQSEKVVQGAPDGAPGANTAGHGQPVVVQLKEGVAVPPPTVTESWAAQAPPQSLTRAVRSAQPTAASG